MSKMKERLDKINEEINVIANKIITEIETASSKEIGDATYVKKILKITDLHHTSQLFREIEQTNEGAVCITEKKVLIKALLLTTWLQRLYFIIRSSLMTLFSAVITFCYIIFFGNIDIYQGIILGVIAYIVTLLITRVFDEQIITVAKKIVRWLAKHEGLRNFIINHF